MALIPVKTLVPLIRITIQIILARICKKRVPVRVSIHVTSKCNLRCAYCYANYNQRFDKGVDDFSTSSLLRLIDELHDLGARWVVLLGGEPLLRNDIGEIITRIKVKNMLCEIVTNGTLIHRNIHVLKQVDLLCISVDGAEDENDLIRGDGTYKKAIKALRLARDHGIRTRIHATLTRANSNLMSMQHLAAVARFFHIRFGVSSPITHDYNAIDAMQLSPDELARFWEMLGSMNASAGLNYYSKKSLLQSTRWHLPTMIVNPSSLPPRLQGRKYRPCLAGHRSCYIDSEGIVYPCIPRGVKNGLNFQEVGITKAWEHLSSSTCYSCNFIQYMELNEVLDLSWRTILQGVLTFLG